MGSDAWLVGWMDLMVQVCVIIDKLDKIGDDAVVCLLGEVGLDHAKATSLSASLSGSMLPWAVAEAVAGAGAWAWAWAVVGLWLG